VEDKQKGKNAEEQLLHELRHAYTEQGMLQPRTPSDKMQAKMESVDSQLKSQHLETESQVQRLISQVTLKMSSSQKFQGMVYLAKQISQLLEGGEESFRRNAPTLSELVQTLEEQLHSQQQAASNETAKSLLNAVTGMAEAGNSMLEASQIEMMHMQAKAMAALLQDQAPKSKPH